MLRASLFALEDERDRRAVRTYNVDCHGAIRGERVAFDGECAGSRGRDFQDVVIPSGLSFEVSSRANRVVVLAAGAIPVEKGLAGALIHKASRDDDNAVLVMNRHGA